MTRLSRSLPDAITGAGTAVLLLLASAAHAATQPNLGAAASSAVLAGSTITSTGVTTVSGDIGLSPGTAIVGLPPGQPTNGVIHLNDAAAAAAKADLGTVYGLLAGLPCALPMTGVDLGGVTLAPGVYCFASAAALNGVLTLDAFGDTSAVFVFQVGSTLVTGTGASVVLVNGAQGSHVWWQVGSSATLGLGSSFVGSLLAQASIGLGTGATVSGRLQARDGAVTMDANGITAFPEPVTLAVQSPGVRRPGLRLDASPVPSVSGTMLRWSLPAAGEVWLEVLDVQGRRVASLLDGVAAGAGAGSHSLDTQGWAPGVYLARLRTAQAMTTRRIVVQD